MIPLYILGILLRYGPQHGYQIKKMILEQLADFTDIKLPTIYYHLEKMEAAGYIAAENVKEGLRPEKRVYHVSGSGKEHFESLLRGTLDISYRPTFEVDSALFFSDHFRGGELLAAFEEHARKLKISLEHISQHQKQVAEYLPDEMRTSAELIFQHHIIHFQAELYWAQEAINRLKEGS